MTAELRELLHDLTADPPAAPDWTGGVRKRVTVRRRRKAAVISTIAAAVVGLGAALPLSWARDDGGQLTPAGPPEKSISLTPSVTEAKVGEAVHFEAVATHPDGTPILQDPFVDASGTSFGECPAAQAAAGTAGTDRRTFDESFDVAGVHTVEISALNPNCQDGSMTATSMIQVSDPKIVLTNDITIEAKVIGEPRAGKSDLVLDVTVTGTREKPAISGFYIDHDVLFLGDSCRPLGILPSRGPGVFHEVYRYRYDHRGTDTITLFASTLCTKQPGQARLDVPVVIAE
jgi:hypothetical protein